MRIFGIALAAALLAGCASAPGESTRAERVEVYPTQPSEAIALEDQQVLFWDDATRADRFRRMEDFFAGIEASRAGDPRELPPGPPLPAETAAAVDAFLASSNAAGIMVIDNGKVRYEKYGLGFGPEQRWTSFSVAKSFTSTLLGAAVADGLIASMDDPVTRYIPELAGTAYEGVSVEQLATMTSGVKWNEDYTDPNSDVAKMLNVAVVPGESQAVTYARTLEREAPAGEKWVYKTLETNLLGVLVEEATGRSLADYAKEKIVDPAGFAGNLFWMTDLTGGNIGGCCLSIRLSDYARFGQFVLEGGEGVVPQGWFAEAAGERVALNTPGFGYGYQWWTYPGAYGAQGIFGQAITVVPEDRLVVAVVSNWPVASSRDLRLQWGGLVQKIAAAD
ncbi:serine hydrolase domain-containing protein [Pelagerythrobacter rhizovicinus]|uniref:Class C beta-lactamase-related serine hydrolase n=1 Tax=Pelagerythrobacter rhizovicinus TaxID=2268576 RepID=A0A4V1QWD9_9SPHN|nr:serine hydrolase [Pelagerythrobacter rhizovicinus]RXZ65816.1 class C beta-lactamase-related serine hydrolase [Pelagerythrobacter rhizovicinus]